jgi:hypothetical protein
MPDSTCPHPWEILSYTLCIIISVAMIWYIHLGANYGDLSRVSLAALLFLAGFCAIIWYSCVRLIFLLVPSRRRDCPACRLLSKIIEIEQVNAKQ